MDTHQHICHLMDQCVHLGASDLHISVGLSAIYRIKGAITPVDDLTFSAEQVQSMAESLMNNFQRDYFNEHMTLDMGFSSKQGMRFRVNVYREMGRCALAIRYLDGNLKTIEELGLPAQIKFLTQLKSGLVLV